MSYRNKKWYLMFLPKMTIEKAYAFINENLKRPSFIHEPKVAYGAFKEVFSKEYASPQEMAALSAAEKIRALEEENERLRIEVKNRVDSGQSELEPLSEPIDEPTNETDHVTNAVVYQTQDEFKAAHPEFTDGLRMHREWKKYAKANGLTIK